MAGTVVSNIFLLFLLNHHHLSAPSAIPADKRSTNKLLNSQLLPCLLPFLLANSLSLSPQRWRLIHLSIQNCRPSPLFPLHLHPIQQRPRNHSHLYHSLPNPLRAVLASCVKSNPYSLMEPSSSTSPSYLYCQVQIR
ncbi:hypothetical protein F5878DRAFT_627268 [Lentinula raphanica]|uniref:Uncharacterized protein n=1 Tax=Lentinula raphanica TaxID=153919 RepID=A0AA38P3L3_9AGAR|nr:hypothetical protein F5878DRAFT_627268 [Lentinula raphanica]